MYCKNLKCDRIFVLTLIFFGFGKFVFAGEVQGVRVWASSESTRVIFDLTEKVNYKLFTIDNPHRVVIDIKNTRLKAKVDQLSLADSGIKLIRHSNRDGGLRFVLDMNAKTKTSSFLLDPNQSYGNRLVVDLAMIQNSLSNEQNYHSQKIEKSEKSQSSVVDLGSMTTREFIVAIDPGHGGDDAGAVGRHHRVKEKDIVFAVSKKLQAMINAQHGMRAFLVRSGDYYIGLRKRMMLAREQGADLFISVHADSFKDPRASGASVFVLSEKGASNEAARWLAERENRADLVGGISLEDKGDLLASVLLDLSQTASQSASHELASHLIANLSKITNLHHKTVQRAGFMVLKSPDIPSVLVELGFISNQRGEEKLLSPVYQTVLAQALLSGVKSYVAKRPAPVKHPQDFTIAKSR